LRRRDRRADSCLARLLAQVVGHLCAALSGKLFAGCQVGVLCPWHGRVLLAKNDGLVLGQPWWPVVSDLNLSNYSNKSPLGDVVFPFDDGIGDGGLTDRRLRLRLSAGSGHRGPDADLGARVRDDHDLAELRGKKQRAWSLLLGIWVAAAGGLVLVHRYGQVDEGHRSERPQGRLDAHGPPGRLELAEPL